MIMSPRGINIFRILAYQRSLCLLYRIVAWHQLKIVAQAQLWNCLTGQKQKLGTNASFLLYVKHATFVYSELFLVFSSEYGSNFNILPIVRRVITVTGSLKKTKQRL